MRTVGAKLKLKTYQIIEQGCDFRREVVDRATAAQDETGVCAIEVGNPLDKEEITDAQLSCLHHKVNAGLPLFAW